MKDTGSDNERKSRVLLTGATGFIGGRLARALVAASCPVRVLVRDPASAAGLEGVEPFPGDLLQPTSLAGIENDVDVVVHCASLLGKWGMDDERVRAVNVDGTLHLLKRFRDSNLSRFVHLSAGGVSGPVATKIVDETYACRPATTYERTKYEAEQRVLELARDGGFPGLVLRPTFTYGPGDPHKLALFRAVKKGRYAFIGDGESVNHPVFIEDLIAGIRLGMERGRAGEVYIIGGERPVTKRELVETIADTLGVSRPWVAIPRLVATPVAAALELLGRAAGFEPILTRSRVMMMADNFGYSIDKARSELGYEPQTGLREGIEKTVRFYRDAGLL